MPEAPEVKWVFMVVVIGGLLMMKKQKTDYEPVDDYETPWQASGPAIATRFSENSKGVVVYRQPKKGGIHNAFNPVNSELTASNQNSAQQIMRENKAKKSGMSREDHMKLRKSMNPEQRKAYLAKRGIKMGDK